jgi:hypothetical protein
MGRKTFKTRLKGLDKRIAEAALTLNKSFERRINRVKKQQQ